MPLETRQPILIDLLDLPPSATKIQEVAIVLQNSGPVLQKLFQLIGKRTDNSLVQEASEQLLANVKPFPFEEVKKSLKPELETPSKRFSR
jgi:predicted unusual protein kinase regulating ubiquinone biosynthesis (AarF/ABC1/UbiB family)